MVTIDFAILHTLHGFGEVKNVIFALGASGEPKLIWEALGSPDGPTMG